MVKLWSHQYELSIQQVRLEVMREWSPVIITCVSVTVSQATNQCTLTLTSLISLVTRTLTGLTNNSQITFLSIDPSFIWQVTCLLVVKKKQWESLQISRLCGMVCGVWALMKYWIRDLTFPSSDSADLLPVVMGKHFIIKMSNLKFYLSILQAVKEKTEWTKRRSHNIGSNAMKQPSLPSPACSTICFIEQKKLSSFNLTQQNSEF